ncbi:unnamed protein product [Rotaria sp. Silwood2]|nr:unnamed protein product [Rotaria sp. Silwood2]CAF2571935.1 unnamed protein product [Rotaria sp. Silwood2]CAF2965093.1 unnamed protein product [Rotaria sp. Silwood2]CAF3346046.1 unnamed protein product [Rotaria sp. Silwood2]CAF3867578.1 unnamed protein product [Rotaria sp. Silwood2]
MLRFTILLICVLAPITISKTIKDPRCCTICRNHCQYGNVLDKKGCPTCRCKLSPCGNRHAPLPGYFCGRGPTHKDCPSNYICVIAPNDAYAVCCRSYHQPVTRPVRTTKKPGSCPPSLNKIGACYAECTTDIDCPRNLKCCGNCPRVCVAPSH